MIFTMCVYYASNGVGLLLQSELKTFQPWVGEVEERIKAGQKKPTSLAEAQEMLKSVQVSPIVCRQRGHLYRCPLTRL